MAPSAITPPSNEVENTLKHQTTVSEINSKLTTLTIPPSPSSSTTPSQADSKSTPLTPSSLCPSQESSDSDPETEIYDLICIGFGPAALSIGIALHDSHLQQSQSQSQSEKKVLYLTPQPAFSWHSGMQLPGAKMQISFLKDLATPRDPTSRFTFLNYLKSVGRLDHFVNLGTFLPKRREWEDYLAWCARWFEERGEVRFGVYVDGVEAVRRESGEEEGRRGKVVGWDVFGRGTMGGEGGGDVKRWRARNVVVAVGGRGVIPLSLQGPGLVNGGRVFHSSEYAHRIQNIERDNEKGRKLKFAVLGSGQSAAEIFNDLWDRFPAASVSLIIKGQSLRPSDDSPFVNEIFNPSHTSTIYSLPKSQREAAISLDRGTNYGVVRLELLEHLYEKIYMQRLSHPDEEDWRCRILNNRVVVSASSASPSSSSTGSQDTGEGVRLRLSSNEVGGIEEEEVEVDYVVAATGYVRDVHEKILERTRDLLLSVTVEEEGEKSGSKFEVGRDYKILYDPLKVDAERAGVWLQGCCEGSHGLSDTLLSVLAIRGREVVESVFGEGRKGAEDGERRL